MNKVFKVAGDAVAVMGILVCVAAGVARLAGSYHILGFQAVTLFIAGIALMVMACLAKLHTLTTEKCHH